ncbi:uncharacterized protein KIAA1755 homolog isoform X2 [Melopsittacus undulatus]|uniref:uncharacterized protein KIAA1755 homolog isoform X2 n=1 Tax=Melopsittacus undulatus TaxID=13146 RepID=UPI00146C6DB2|nr:uncharacterized protein KIAA1755 homolog isoform X2 [Melopsittacus undulatus]
MDAGSLDAAVQGALQALYPPFDATAPTVLGQVFRLLETSYQGDGLCCLLQFLIPAKRLFEHVRQAACAPYFNCIFLHEGWPLCLHEKVVVHLAPLNPLLLRPGDFYLQAEPCEEHSARIVLKHLSQDLCTVEEMLVPEAAYGLLFTNEWLEEINGNRAGVPLQTCLVATENGIAPLPWGSIATPEFIDKPKAGADGTSVDTQHEPASEAAAESAAPSVPMPHSTAGTPVPYSNVVGTIPGCKGSSRKPSQGKYPGLIKVEQAGLRRKPSALAMPSLCEIISQNLEGEYVDLLESPQQMGLLGRALPMGAGDKAELPCVNGGPCGAAPSSEQGPCTPCLGQELSREPHGPRCRHRDSYLAALQNPVSFGAGLMAAILEEPDGPGPEPPPSAPHETPAQCGMGAGSPTLLSPRSQAGVRQSSPRLPHGSGHKFSFLKGPRLGAAPGDERGSSQQEGAWRKVSAIYSPRMGRAKAAGKGLDVAAPAPAEERPMESSGCKNGPSMPSTSTVGWEPPAWQDLHVGLLHSGIVCLPGSKDRQGRALLQVTTSGSAWGASWCSAAELGTLILYLCSIARQDVKDTGLTIVVDARKQPPAPVLFSALRSVQSISPGCIHTVLLLADKELGTHREKLPGVQVESLPSLKALGRFVDSSQLTPELDGAFPYSHGEWVQFFQKLHPFMASLRRASELLRSCIQELRSGNALVVTQDAGACIVRHRELMRRVLSDAPLVWVQREGGSVLARLRREAARLRTSAHVRTSMESAEALYNQLEEALHDLVFQSNSSLERLEFLRKVRELEAEFSKAQYRHGLVLCQEAAEVQDAAFPEASLFQAAAALFRTKLTSFHRQVERRQAERELLRDLGCFSSKMAGLKLGCRQCLVRGQREEGRALQGLQSSFQKLLVEFALEKLQEMKAQVRRMRSSPGLAAWTEARHRYQETRQVLEEMLAELQEAWGAQAEGLGDSFSRPGSGSAAHCEGAAGTSPEPVVPGEQPEPSAGTGQPHTSSVPSPSLGAEPSSPQPHGHQGPGGDPACPHCASANTSVPKPESGACPGAAGQLIPNSLHRHPLTLPARVRPPGTDPPCPTTVPHGLCPTAVPHGLCPTAVPHGAVTPAHRRAEYFQVSSQSSFSSEDSDSQHSTEDAPAPSLALPWDLHSPRPRCPPEKPSQIVYLENPHTESSAKANAK